MNQNQIEYDELNKQAIWYAREDLLAFTMYTKLDYHPNWHHRVVANCLNSVINEEIKRIIIAMPPQHGKSELCVRRLIPFALGKNPKERIILATHTSSLAESLNRDIRRVINSPEFDAVFPDYNKFKKIRIKKSDSFLENSYGGFVRAAGIGSSITGLGADLAILDDYFASREAAESPTQRKKIWEWYISEFLTRLSTRARIVIISTRWHKDDIIGRILENKNHGFQVINFKAIKDDLPCEYDPREPGDALWPEFRDIDSLKEIKRIDPYSFAALYQQDPTINTSAEFPVSYFTDDLFCKVKNEDFYGGILAVDPSKGKSDKSGDYSAIAIANQKNNKILVDGFLERLPVTDLCNKIIQYYLSHKPNNIIIESNQHHGLLEEFLNNLAKSILHRSIPITPVINTDNKLFRIRKLGVFLADNKLIFNDNDYCRNGVDQIQQFPIGNYDDFPDALEMALRFLKTNKYEKPTALDYNDVFGKLRNYHGVLLNK